MRKELLTELEWKDPQLLSMMENARAELSRNIENDWIVPYSDIVVNRELLVGQGSFGCVYQGAYSGCPCAMKEIVVSNYENVGGFSKQTITREVSILSIVSHPNIVRFFGTSYNKQNIIIITEYFPATLASYIENSAGNTIEKNIHFNNVQKRRVLIQVISAISYLHARLIVHRDLKCDNVLIHENRGTFEAKICDFGSAKVIMPLSSKKNKTKRRNHNNLSSGSSILGNIGSPMYSPPEVLQNGSLQSPLLSSETGAVHPLNDDATSTNYNNGGNGKFCDSTPLLRIRKQIIRGII